MTKVNKFKCLKMLSGIAIVIFAFTAISFALLMFIGYENAKFAFMVFSALALISSFCFRRFKKEQFLAEANSFDESSTNKIRLYGDGEEKIIKEDESLIVENQSNENIEEK